MPVEALWRWLRGEATYHRRHASPGELIGRAEALRQTINTNTWAVADRLWAKDTLDPGEENHESQGGAA